jgi:hypothetical protein
MVRVRILPTDSSMMIGYKFFWLYLIDHTLAVRTGHITHQHKRTTPLRSLAISYFLEPSPITDYTVQLGVTGFYFLEGVMVKVKLNRSSWFCILYSVGFGFKSQPCNGPFWECLWFYAVARVDSGIPQTGRDGIQPYASQFMIYQLSCHSTICGFELLKSSLNKPRTVK